MGGEANQVLWRGVQPVAGIAGVWPARDATRVNEAQPQDGVGIIQLKIAPAGKKFFLSSGILSSALRDAESCNVSMYVIDDEDVMVYALLRHSYYIAGHQSTSFMFMPALEVPVGYRVMLYVQHAKLKAYASIFGWQEDV